MIKGENEKNNDMKPFYASECKNCNKGEIIWSLKKKHSQIKQNCNYH